MPGLFEDADVISVYTRKQAIEDGVLVDVSKGQRLFKFPVALTRTVWTDCVEWPEDDMQAMQDQTGRLSDVLWMTLCAVRRGGMVSRGDACCRARVCRRSAAAAGGSYGAAGIPARPRCCRRRRRAVAQRRT